jgi:hypothetical protein
MAQTTKLGAVLILVLVAGLPLAAREFSFDNLHEARTVDRPLFATGQDGSASARQARDASVGVWIVPPFTRFASNPSSAFVGIGGEAAWLFSPELGGRVTLAWYDGTGGQGLTVATAICWRAKEWPSGALYFDVGVNYGRFRDTSVPVTHSLGMELVFGTEFGSRHRRGRGFIETGLAVLHGLHRENRAWLRTREVSDHAGVHWTLFRIGMRFYV